MAQEGDDSSKLGDAIINITVLDSNDNPPEFVGDPYRFNVSENLDNGAFVGTVLATDSDADATETVSLCM